MSSLFLISGFITNAGNVFSWLENHPQSVEIIKSLISTLIPCICFREILIFVLKPHIERRNKQIQAETTFYPALRKKVTLLRDMLKRNKRLEVSDKNAGNIYVIQYKKDVRHSYCKKYKEDIPVEELIQYKQILEEIREIIDNTEVNVTPKKCKREDWENSQISLMLFYKLIEAKCSGVNVEIITNKAPEEEAQSPPHILECNKLIQAMDILTKYY